MKNLETDQAEMRERMMLNPYPSKFAGTAELTPRQQEIKAAIAKRLPDLFS